MQGRGAHPKTASHVTAGQVMKARDTQLEAFWSSPTLPIKKYGSGQGASYISICVCMYISTWLSFRLNYLGQGKGFSLKVS